MKFTKVLIAYDGSPCADAALEDLRRAGLPEKAHAVIFSVVESWLPPPSSLEIFESVDYREEILTLARRGADRVETRMPAWVIDPLVGFGSPASVLIEKADEWLPDLIVAGSHGHNAVGGLFLGNVSQKLTNDAHCGVRVGRGRVEKPNAPVRLIVGVDGSKGAEAAVDVVASRRWPQGSEARIVNASWKIPPITSEQAFLQLAEWVARENASVTLMVESAEKRLKAAGLVTSIVMKEEEPKRLLIGEAERWGADCIFVGARGIGRMERFLIGSVSSAVSARAHCSVEVVRIP
jgi:nucleotide-binding universal stress UspA family protein